MCDEQDNVEWLKDTEKNEKGMGLQLFHRIVPSPNGRNNTNRPPSAVFCLPDIDGQTGEGAASGVQGHGHGGGVPGAIEAGQRIAIGQFMR